MKRALILAAVSAISLVGVVPAAQAELRVGKNYRLNSDRNGVRGQDQIGLAVNPATPRHIVEVHANYFTEECEHSVSRDGGVNWEPVENFTVPASINNTSCRVPGHAADQMYQRNIAFGSGQNVYVVYVTASRNAATGNDEGSSVLLAKSTNGGSSFGAPVVLMAGGPSEGGGPNFILPTLTVDPARAGGPASDRIYISAYETSSTGLSALGDVAFVRSTDGGQTFTNETAVDPAGEDAVESSGPALGPNGELYIAWRQVGKNPAVPTQSTPQGVVRVARSADQGQTWTPFSAASVTGGGMNTSRPLSPLPFSTDTHPRIAVDRRNGNVYIVYGQGDPGPGQLQAADHFIHPDMDIYFQRSTNRGQSWSAPKLINDATKREGQFFTQNRHPNMSVAPNGRVDIVWQDRHHWYQPTDLFRTCVHTHVRCDEARLGDTYYAFSANGGSDFRRRRITDRSHNNDNGFDYRFGNYWTFGPISVPLANSELLVAWMDSREGNFENDNSDIYLARASHAASTRLPQENLARPAPGPLSVQLSRHTYPGGGEGLHDEGFANRNGVKVVIVNQNDVPAILAAGVLARANLSQVLVSPPNGLPADVEAEIRRMNSAGAYIIGSEASLGNQVRADVQDAIGADTPEDPNPVVRLQGAGDAGTAAAIARALDRRTDAQKTANAPPAFDAVVIANPASPDASAAAGLAAARRLPFMYVSADSIPQATSQALAELDIDKTLVVGGTQWVSSGVASQLPGARRLGGANQYATSQQVVAESISRGLPPNIVYVADGERPIDAALLGSTVGRVTGLLMLAPQPLNTTGAQAASANGLCKEVDRLILLGASGSTSATDPCAAAAPGRYPLPPLAGPAAFADCPSLTANVIRGTAANNTITGTPRGDRIFAGTGDDVVDSLAGDDCVDLGPGTDRGQGGDGKDLILGGLGRDRIAGNRDNDRLRGGSSADRLIGGFGNDRMHGQSGNDRLNGERGRDRINGGSSNDVISAGSSNDRAAGDQGRDRIFGNSGNDVLKGNSGRDRLSGGSGRDRISGGSGNDRISARDGRRDRINCGSGRDRVVADRIDRVSRNCERVRRR